jgi:hypothetical protein
MTMNQRNIILVLAGLLALAVGAFGWSLTRGYDTKKEEVRTETAARAGKETDQPACASNATYARLKEVAFEEAVRLRNADPANLDTLAAQSVVRMENPVVLSRDKDLNVTVCSGRFILELPPGAEVAFGGQRRLTANVEYAAQAAADGSGMVYEVRGAEPIIQKLAAFNMRGGAYLPSNQTGDVALAEAPPAPRAPAEQETQDSDPMVDETPSPRIQTPAPPPPPPAPVREARRAPTPPAPEPAPRPAPKRAESDASVQAARGANPSFNCRYARSRSERSVCSSERLAAKDRAMSSLFYSALADADSRTRTRLRQTRDRFLAYRENCGSEACIAEAYDGRMLEIRDIMAEAR